MTEKSPTYLGLLISISMILTGCFGGGVVHTKSETWRTFTLKEGHDIRFAFKTNTLTSNQVQEIWGKPSSVRTDKHDLVVWRYKKRDHSMVGIWPMFVIGIPIVVPTGHHHIDIYFKDGIAVQSCETYTGCSGGYYGPKNEASSEMSFNKLEWETRRSTNDFF